MATMSSIENVLENIKIKANLKRNEVKPKRIKQTQFECSLLLNTYKKCVPLGLAARK